MCCQLKDPPEAGELFPLLRTQEIDQGDVDAFASFQQVAAVLGVSGNQ